MPESEAVYQPTTVGYSYDAGGDGNDTGNGIRNGFSRIIFRHKVSTRKWAEWVLLSVAICASVAGLATLLVNLMATTENTQTSGDSMQEHTKDPNKDDGAVEEHVDNSRGSVAVGATIMLAGLLMGCGWVWLRFSRRTKSPRGGMARGSGQMLGGLNPSTDLLVGSTSQYGPVLTEVPSQMMPNKLLTNQHDSRTASIPLSDQEEETRTLMSEATNRAASVNTGATLPVSSGNNTNTGEILPNSHITG